MLQNIIFICSFITLGVVVEYPITVHVDNVGAILLSVKTLLSLCKTHVGMYRRSICDCIEDGTVNIQFFRSEENLVNPFTNNLNNGLFELFTSSYVHRE